MFTQPRAALASIAIAAMAASISTAGAETIRIRLEYPQESVLLVEEDGVTTARLPECEFLARPGAPALPMCAEQIVLPEGTTVHGLEAVAVSTVRIPCGAIAPAQSSRWMRLV